MLLFISCLFRDIYASDSSAKTLLVSFVGMQTQEVEIKPHVKVTLKSDSEMLDEVVVVAYGTASRQSITGAVASIDSKN